MSAILRTMGAGLFSAFLAPVIGITGIAAIVALLILVFSSELRSFGLFLIFLSCSAIFVFASMTLQRVEKRGQLLVEKINTEKSLRLSVENMLGHPNPVFVVFDKSNGKLALCNRATDEYRIHDFGHVLKWYYEWGIGRRTNIGITGGAPIRGTGMHEPNFSQSEFKNNFKVVLEVADERNPILKFSVQSEDSAQRWCAKLNAIFNG